MPLKPAYETKLGRTYCSTAEKALSSDDLRRKHGKVQLIFTSPPFPLRTKKRYGNATGEEFVAWLASFAGVFRELLTTDGSLVIEMGNAWEAGQPVMSTLGVRSLLALQERGDFVLCQEFVVHNIARLPGPAQWVNVERIRVKDSFTKIWWLSSTARPKANNRAVLTEYSPDMRRLIETGRYTAGERPSQHVINATSFAHDNGGAIPSSVLSVSNTRSSDEYLRFCRDRGLQLHPARMPAKVAEFFIRFLTDKGDLVLDPFAGSNTTGRVAESLRRRWIAIEANKEYVKGSRIWFNTSPRR